MQPHTPASAAALHPPPLASRERALSHWTGWSIRARCADPTCPPGRPVLVDDVLTARGDVTLDAMADQMRCCACGQPAERVCLASRMSGGEIVMPVRGGAIL